MKLLLAELWVLYPSSSKSIRGSLSLDFKEVTQFVLSAFTRLAEDSYNLFRRLSQMQSGSCF